MKQSASLATVLLAALWAAAGLAAVPLLVGYQGHVPGQPAGQSTATLTFTIYDAPSSGNALWTETQQNVQLFNGNYSVALGSVTPLTADLFSEPDRYVGVESGGEAVQEPQRFASAPYAVQADTAGSVPNALQTADGEPDAFYVDADGNVGIGTTTPGAMLEVVGAIHSTTGGFIFPDGTVQASAVTGLENASSLEARIAALEAQVNPKPQGSVAARKSGIGHTNDKGVPLPNARLGVAGTILVSTGYLEFPDNTRQFASPSILDDLDARVAALEEDVFAPGTPRWTKHYGSAGFDTFEFITAGPNNEVVFAGRFSQGDVDIEGESVPAGDFWVLAKLENGLSADTALVRAIPYDFNFSAGAALVAPNGDIYVAGVHSATVDFQIPGTPTPFVDRGSFLVKFDKDLNTVWGMAMEDQADWKTMEFDKDGDLLLGGSFNDDFFTIGADFFTNKGRHDMLLLKLSVADGSPIWARSWGGEQDDFVNSIAVASDNSLYIHGTIGLDVVMTPQVILDHRGIVSNVYPDRLYVVRLSELGIPIWGKSYTDQRNTRDDVAGEVVVDSTDNVWMGAHAYSDEDYGGGPLGTPFREQQILVGYNVDGDHLFSQAWETFSDAVFFHSPADGVFIWAFDSGTGSLSDPIDFGGGPIPDGHVIAQIRLTNGVVSQDWAISYTASSAPPVGMGVRPGFVTTGLRFSGTGDWGFGSITTQSTDWIILGVNR